MQQYTYRRILVPYDGLESSAASVGLAASLAGALGAELCVLHVVATKTIGLVRDEIGAPSDTEAEEYCRRRYGKAFGRLHALQTPGLQSRTVVKFAPSPLQGILEFCRGENVDLVHSRFNVNANVIIILLSRDGDCYVQRQRYSNLIKTTLLDIKSVL